MLSRKFIAENLSINLGNEVAANNNSHLDQDIIRDRESTSTTVSYLSTGEPSLRDCATDSTQMLRHRLNVEQELDFGIPGAYR